LRLVLIFSLLLAAGLAASQALPLLLGTDQGALKEAIQLLTMLCLSFIMIHVGYEFEIDRSNLRPYLVDYGVAFTSASFPWIFCTLYFVVALVPSADWGSFGTWRQSLLAGRFAAPTSAGILFSMLAAAGLSATWMFRKTRILAIFDDLDTVLLMIPLKMLIVGLRWQLGPPHGPHALAGLEVPPPAAVARDLALGAGLRGRDHVDFRAHLRLQQAGR